MSRSAIDTPLLLVVAAVIERDGVFLLARRPPGKTLANHWEFPGGKLENGESPQQALVRELHEELGAQGVYIGERVGIARHDYGPFAVEIDAYRVKCDTSSLVAHEHAELGWFTPSKMREIQLAPADTFLIEILELPTNRLKAEVSRCIN